MRATEVISPLRTKNGIAAGEFATYATVHGGHVKMHVQTVVRDYNGHVTITARVTSPTRYGYRRGEVVTMRDTAFLSRRPTAEQPPNDLVKRAMSGQGRSFLFCADYGWTMHDRPPGNAPFYVVDAVRWC